MNKTRSNDYLFLTEIGLSGCRPQGLLKYLAFRMDFEGMEKVA